MSSAAARQFESHPAVRAEVPLLIGLMGPSGGGKTLSALRLARGIQRIRGGDICYIDTEADRALHYAPPFKFAGEEFRFQHVPFRAPFGSLDYLSAIRYCVEQKRASVVVVDSMSHEHEGEGGYLLTQEAELQRIAGDNQEKRERAKFTAWIKPAAHRRHLINGLLQLKSTFIFCFRAKEKTKPVTGGKPIDLGWMPIAGEEFLFEMTVTALLLPRADGVPTWHSEKSGESMMMKLPEQFRDLFARREPISEAHGVAMAEWARGTTTDPVPLLTARADKLEAALRGAKSLDDVKGAWSRAAALCDELKTAAPSVLEQVNRVFEARTTDFQEAAK